MNVAELERLADHFEKKTGPVDMGRWLNDCGTAGCIAGEACLLAGGRMGYEGCKYVEMPGDPGLEYVPDVAGRLLGLAGTQKATLFLFPMWPKQFREESRGRSRSVRPSTVAARIRHFIASGGTE